MLEQSHLYCDGRSVILLQDSSQIELLKELMDLQKDMIVMMLSLLEGEGLHPLLDANDPNGNNIN